MASAGRRYFDEGLSSNVRQLVQSRGVVHNHAMFRETFPIHLYRKNLALRTLRGHGLSGSVLRLIDDFCESNGTVANAPIVSY